MTNHPRISAHDDPEGEAPWVLTIVTRVEKNAPPTRTATCEGAAHAVLALLTDPRATDDSEWAAAINRWTSGRIRKHTRRARGALWDRALAIPGVRIEHDGAEVAAFIPTATDAIPRELAKLQLSGSELDDPGAREHRDASTGTLVIALTPRPRLTLGKAAAACGHAAQIALMNMPNDQRDRWTAAGYPLAVEQPADDNWDARVADADVVIADAGFTEIAPGTVTAVARWH